MCQENFSTSTSALNSLEYHKLTCQICGKTFNDFALISAHIRHIHKLKIKDYYDKYFNKIICIMCNDNEAVFRTLRYGYLDRCHSCLNKYKKKKAKKEYLNNIEVIKNVLLKRKEFLKKLSKKEVEEEKMLCQICLTNFSSRREVGKHITRYHKISLEEYHRYCFDINDEYKCRKCGHPKELIDWVSGYKNKCKGKDHFKNTDEKLKCCICGMWCSTKQAFSFHILKEHKIKYKDYYDRYILKENENKCRLCNHETTFLNIHEGYTKYCSTLCSNMSALTKERKEKSFLQRYGHKTYTQTKEYRNRMEDRGLITPIKDYTAFTYYRRLVENETYKHKKELYKKWDGKDYYDGEMLITNNEYKKMYPKMDLSNNVKQPTVDHKLSVYYCFKNNISVEDCGGINNLCICSRSNNSIKHSKIEDEFKTFINTIEHNKEI